MGRKKIALVNIDNYAEFIFYINARAKRFTMVRIAELLKLIAKAEKIHLELEIAFEEEFAVLTHEPDTFNDEHRKVLADIDCNAFKNVNAFIDDIPKLKTAFKNARAQARHKAKNKFTGNDRVPLEMSFKERFVLLEIRKLCKENELDFHEQLSEFKCELYSKINITK